MYKGHFSKILQALSALPVHPHYSCFGNPLKKTVSALSI